MPNACTKVLQIYEKCGAKSQPIYKKIADLEIEVGYGYKQVFYKDESIWATQEAIATLFDKGRSTITEHLRNIFESGELQPDVVCRKFRHTTQHGAIEGKTQTKEVTFYNLDAGQVSAEQAKEYAETEFEKYRVIQDRIFESDFDRFELPTLPFDKEN